MTLRESALAALERCSQSIEADSFYPTTDFDYLEEAIEYTAKIYGYPVDDLRREVELIESEF